MKKKSEIGLQFIVVLLVTLAAAFAYFVWLKDYRIFSEDLSDYTICRNSNIENAKLKLKISNQALQERQGNRCTTSYIDVEKGKEIETTAKKMAQCWDMYLEGKEQLFATEDNNYCAFCSVLMYENKKPITGLTEHLVKNSAPGKGKTYYQYLTNTVVTKDVFAEIENSHLNELHSIDASKPLAVIFVESKNANPGSLTGQSSVVTASEGATAGVVLGTLATLTGYGFCATGVGCLLGVFLIGAGTGGGAGYLIGSNYGPDTDTKVLLWPYTQEDLKKLNCTILEGKDNLEIKKY